MISRAIARLVASAMTVEFHVKVTRFFHSSLTLSQPRNLDILSCAKGLHQWLSVRWKNGSNKRGNPQLMYIVALDKSQPPLWLAWRSPLANLQRLGTIPCFC